MARSHDMGVHGRLKILRDERMLRLERLKTIIDAMRIGGSFSSTPLAPLVGCEPATVRTYFRLMEKHGVAFVDRRGRSGSAMSYVLVNNEILIAEFFDAMRATIDDVEAVALRRGGPIKDPLKPNIRIRQAKQQGMERPWYLQVLFGTGPAPSLEMEAAA